MAKNSVKMHPSPAVWRDLPLPQRAEVVCFGSIAGLTSLSAMQIFPKNKEGWLEVVLLPFKAFTVIAPVLFVISSSFPRSRHVGATDVEVFLIFGLYPCAALLLFTAVVLSLVGQKRIALSCLGFGLAAAVIIYLFLPRLAHS